MVDLILNDQLFVLDNVVSEFIFHLMQRRDHINVPLELDALPCETTKDDLLAALMQLLAPMGMYIFRIYLVHSLHCTRISLAQYFF